MSREINDTVGEYNLLLLRFSTIFQYLDVCGLLNGNFELIFCGLFFDTATAGYFCVHLCLEENFFRLAHHKKVYFLCVSLCKLQRYLTRRDPSSYILWLNDLKRVHMFLYEEWLCYLVVWVGTYLEEFGVRAWFDCLGPCAFKLNIAIVSVNGRGLFPFLKIVFITILIVILFSLRCRLPKEIAARISVAKETTRDCGRNATEKATAYNRVCK